ncbi:MAG: Na+/H+ antiporter NhaA [Bacteroidota bacterium]
MQHKTSFIKHLLKSDSFGGLLLMVCVVISLLVANSGLMQVFNQVLKTPIGYNLSFAHLQYPLINWINDGLMAIFFLFVGLEIKREVLNGELSDTKNATLPVFAAIGGMAVPALIYMVFNHGKATANGWGVPMATDIAFAIAILSVLGRSIPLSLKVFLKALAIVDDLGAIVVIAIFYSAGLSSHYLMLAAITFAVQIAFNYFGFKHLAFYLIPGVFLWYFIHSSGIHATVAGVLTAFTIPMDPDDQKSPLLKLEHALESPVNFIIIPIFALANTNIHFEWDVIVRGVTSPLGLGIMAGLFLGKPIGITLCAWIAVKTKLSALPKNTNWLQLWGAGQLGGIGFTMSIFITLLSFHQAILHDEGKLAILIASVAAALAGYVVLKIKFQKNVIKR